MSVTVEVLQLPVGGVGWGGGGGQWTCDYSFSCFKTTCGRSSAPVSVPVNVLQLPVGGGGGGGTAHLRV